MPIFGNFSVCTCHYWSERRRNTAPSNKINTLRKMMAGWHQCQWLRRDPVQFVYVWVWVCVFLASHLLHTHWRAQLPKFQCRISWWSRRETRRKDMDHCSTLIVIMICSYRASVVTGLTSWLAAPLDITCCNWMTSMLSLCICTFDCFLKSVLQYPNKN